VLKQWRHLLDGIGAMNAAGTPESTLTKVRIIDMTMRA
jgi:hypothetical protein